MDSRLAQKYADENPEEATEEATAPAEETAKAESDELIDQLIESDENQENAKATAAQREALRKSNPLFARLNPYPYSQGGEWVAGIAHYSDTAEINRMLASPEAKAILPRDLVFLWGVKSFSGSDQYFELFNIKSDNKNGQPDLTGDVVTESKADFDQHGNPVVSMAMNTEGARKWATLTRQNVGRGIAIVLDGYVYSAPNVKDEDRKSVV